MLVLHASVEGQTERIAQRIGARLRDKGHRVDVKALASGAELSGYDAIVVGASVHYGRHPARLAAFVRANAALLAARSTAFFSVSLGAKPRYAARFLRQACWQPGRVAVFAGALRYARYGPLKRALVRAFAWLGGHDTDTSRDHEYTDWAAVEGFAAACAEFL